MKLFKFLVGPGLLAALLVGCAQTSPYHSNSAAAPKASITSGTNFKLAFVEFGEQGSFQQRSQLANAVDLIRHTPKPLVVTFVHGWHNNAGSHNAASFHQILADLANSESIRRNNYTVIGVYLGRRGEIITAPYINDITFWNRKAAAERLASNFDCYEAIASIAEAARSHESQYTILIGHSFGGLVVERSVAHGINAAIHSHADFRKALPADLVLLLNPASDSILTKQMVSDLYANHIKQKRQFIVSLTSTGDHATGMAIPAATNLAATTKAFDKVAVPGDEQNQVSERVFFTATPGHNPLLVNHKTERFQLDREPLIKGSLFEANLLHNHAGHGFYVENDNKKNGRYSIWQILPEKGNTDEMPYWIVSVDPSIIKDHNDIWNDKARSMIAAIFKMNFPHHLASKALKPKSAGEN